MPVDSRLISATITGTQRTFQQMLGWRVAPSKFTVGEIPSDSAEPSSIISARIQFTGRISGSMTLTQPIRVAEDMTSAMLDTDVAGSFEDTKDVVGEMLNMIISAAKCSYDSKEEPFSIALPTVAIGSESHDLPTTKNGESISWLEFATDRGDTVRIRVHVS